MMTIIEAHDIPKSVRESLTNSSSGLPCWLVEPSPNIVLPMFFEVPIRDNVVVLHHGLP